MIWVNYRELILTTMYPLWISCSDYTLYTNSTDYADYADYTGILTKYRLNTDYILTELHSLYCTGYSYIDSTIPTMLPGHPDYLYTLITIIYGRYVPCRPNTYLHTYMHPGILAS